MDEVLRSALTEEDHVARLRKEKRKLLIEQKRLKAMKDMQKSDANIRTYTRAPCYFDLPPLRVVVVPA